MPADVNHKVVASNQPHDSSLKVWRYMDVTKLVALLETQSLRFTRAEELGDPFEGSLALPNQIVRDHLITELLETFKKNSPKLAQLTHSDIREQLADLGHKGRQWVFVNCWHSGSSESLAMWRQYGASDGSVVIQSTYQKLLDALPSEIHINKDISKTASIHMGMVQYKEYSSLGEGLTLNGNMLAPFIHKRSAFEYEKEVRALLLCPFIADLSTSGIDVDVDIEQLVETLRVQPGTPDWKRKTIESLIRKYDLGMKVTHSEIDIDPVY